MAKKQEQEQQWSEPLGNTVRAWYAPAESIGVPIVAHYRGVHGEGQRRHYELELAAPAVGYRRAEPIQLDAGDTLACGCKSGLRPLEQLADGTLVRIVALECTELPDGRRYWVFDVRAAAA